MGTNAAIGGLFGIGIDGLFGDDATADGALTGAAIGALGGSRTIGRALARGWQQGAPLEVLRREAMQVARNHPGAMRAIELARTPQQIHAIVDEIVSRSRVRLTEGGF